MKRLAVKNTDMAGISFSRRQLSIAIASFRPDNLRYCRMSKPDTKTFLQRTRAAKKIMVLDLGFLGDTVHLLPALWMVRQAYPQAELHCAVAAHVTSLMDCVPWVNRVWGYMRFPRHATSARKSANGLPTAPGEIRRGHQSQWLRPLKLADVFERRARTAGTDAGRRRPAVLETNVHRPRPASV